jgi:regulation of enolase protein 1 (concanavalin A-like superfamily)
MAKLMRPEGGSSDHFGYGTLTFTLNAEKSPYPPSPVPPLPSKLTAEAGVRRIFLHWQGSRDTAQGYAVSRATAAAGPFKVVSSWHDSTRCEFIDTDVKGGTRYSYRVAARNQSGTSDPCTPASATPADAGDLPTGWTSNKIGDGTDSDAGFADVSGGTFVLRGSGSGIGRASDGICFISHAVSGDICLTARISEVTWARNAPGQKIGIMIRQSPEPGSPMFLMKLGDVGQRQARAGFRAESNGVTQWAAGNDYTWIPAWFRLKRVGEAVTAYESSDGVQWFEVRSAAFSLTAESRIGLFVGGGTDIKVNFDHVSLEK